ncbi:MAG TPA: peptidoglycan-associated lipoprotein Pal [Thermoanaerobaculia bacterium]|nr:peptidoglycan-associated lipoprotein Pal [Thermoanaerobaculia bacterium]
MRRFGWLAMVVLILCVPAGCRKKPKTMAEAPALEVPVTATTPEPMSDTPEPAAAPADPLEGDDMEAINAYVRERGLLGDVYYQYDSFDLAPEARQRLADNARFFSRYPQFEALIEGHCDERGTAEYNLALGERRANSALDYLSSLGVDGARLRTLSYGKERPVCSEESESCWSQNRRARFVLVGRRHAG